MHSINSDRRGGRHICNSTTGIFGHRLFRAGVLYQFRTPQKSKSKRLEDAIAAKEKELAKIMRYKQALY